MSSSHIVCRHSPTIPHWSAWFDDHPETTFTGDEPAAAVRRLLEAMYQRFIRFRLDCDQIEAGPGGQMRQIIWAPPDLLMQCDECGGAGDYTARNDPGPCRKCQGAGTVKW